MKDMIRQAFNYYNSFVAQAELDVDWAKAFLNEEQLRRLALARMRTALVDNWQKMLTSDERFTIEKHFIENLEWARVAHSFGKHWDSIFFRSERQLGTYQANALEKIGSFCETYEELIHGVFDSLNQTEHLLEVREAKKDEQDTRSVRSQHRASGPLKQQKGGT